MATSIDYNVHDDKRPIVELTLIDKTNDRKIQTIMDEFSDQFNQKYQPPIEKNSYFYEIYPSKELTELVDKYKNQKSNDTKNSDNDTDDTESTDTDSHDTDITIDDLTVHSNPQNSEENDESMLKNEESKKRDEHDKNEDIMLSIRSMNDKRIRPQKVLLWMDFDDTLIPSNMLKVKNYQITKNKLSYTERKELREYADSLNNYMDKMLTIFDNNIDKNVQILTNGSSHWVTDESMWQSGKLFSHKMVPFMRKMTECKIDIISALDNWKLNCHKYEKGFDAIEPHKWKWMCMKTLIIQYFGRKLKGDCDVKIISIGDSYSSEYLGAADAFKHYLKKQKMNVVNGINMSLHRIKLIEKPSWNELNAELKWITNHIEYIVNHSDESADYMLDQKIRDLSHSNNASK